MELNEKIQMLLDMQEHPENYSEQTLETMLKDPEVRELMEATAQLKQAMTWENESKNTANVDAEWQHFSKTHYNESKPRRGWLKVAATFIGVLFITGMAFATIHIVRNVVEKDTKAPVQKTEISDSHQPVISADTIKSDTIVMATPVVFDNVTLDSIAKDIAAYHHIGMDLQNDQAKQLRFYFVWKRNDSLQEVVEKLNMFEHVNMAVECDYWHLWRYNPALAEEGKNPFSLDSKEPNWENFHDFLLGEVRYLSVKKAYPNEAEELFAEAQKMAQIRYKTYIRKSQENWED